MATRLFSRVMIVTVLLLSSGISDAQSKPNVILIMADDMGYECLGTYGSASYRTPVLDRLAAGGIRFDHCYSQPLCTPSRVKIMTGRYNYRNYQAFGHLDPTETTFGHLMKKAGYTTCIAGKWQLHGRQEGWEGKGARPRQAGFDYYCLWQIVERGSRYADPVIEVDGRAVTTFDDEYGPDMFTDYILDFLETHRDEPFFVYFPMCLVHNPFVPTPDSAAWAEGDRNEKDNTYFADMVAYTDAIVGRIVSKLDALGLRENTLVMFTGDNGTNKQIRSKMTDGREIRGDKGMPTDGGTRVPLIANWPDTVPAGVVSKDLISFSDFLPTLVEIGGGSVPSEGMIDGRSFAPQLRGERGDPREWMLCHYDPQWGDRERVRFARSVRWKLYDDGRMYDMAVDVEESAPLAPGDDDSAREKVRGMLREVLERNR